MSCPKCQKEHLCGCKICKPRHDAAGVISSNPEGDYDSCGHCGHRMSLDDWLDESWRQYKAEKK